MKKVSIVIPVYNEKDTLSVVIKNVEKLDFCGLEKEIIIIDDASNDGTKELYGSIVHKIIYHKINLGKGAAVRSGLEVATGDIIVIQDADLECDPKDLEEAVKQILDGECIVCNVSRFINSNPSNKTLLFFTLGNKIINKLVNLFYNTNITDILACHKAILKSVLDNLNLKSNGFELETEIVCKLLKNNIKILEIPASKYVARNKKEGKKIKYIDGFKIVFTLLKCRFCK